MPRPSTPILSRHAIAESALAIIDRNGVDAFSMPTLAKELGVRAPSLYHHFRDRAEILAEVAKRIIGEAALPPMVPGPDWPDTFVELSHNFRQAILRHANAAPILLQFTPRDVLTPLYEVAAVYLAECGVPIEQHILILDGLEKLSIGSALIEAVKADDARAHTFAHLDDSAEPTLARATAANSMDSATLFEASIRAFLVGVVSTVPAEVPR